MRMNKITPRFCQHCGEPSPDAGQGTASFSDEGSSNEDFFEAEQDDYPF